MTEKAEKRVWYRYEKVWFDSDGMTKSIAMCPGPNPKAEILAERPFYLDDKHGIEIIIRFTAVS